MKKSSDITKYEANWQFARCYVKKLELNDKLAYMRQFYIDNFSIDNRERIINWLEGLVLGYKKNSLITSLINDEVIFFTNTSPIIKEKNRKYYIA